MNRIIGALLLVASTVGYAMLVMYLIAREVERERLERIGGGWPALQRNRIHRRRYDRAAR